MQGEDLVKTEEALKTATPQSADSSQNVCLKWWPQADYQAPGSFMANSGQATRHLGSYCSD